MNNKTIFYIVGTINLVEGFLGLTYQKIYIRGWDKVTLYEAFLWLLSGFIFIVIGLNIKNKIQYYSKCPQCKTAYDYQKLNKGMCPKCHIPTIDMDEYFKHFPDELKDEKESNVSKKGITVR